MHLRRRLPVLSLLLALAAGPVLAQQPAPFVAAPSAPALGPATAGPQVALEASPAGLAYVPNHGQWPEEVLFQTRSGGMTVWITREGLTYDFYETELTSGRSPERGGKAQAETETTRRGHVVRMAFDGGLARGVTQTDKLPGVHNYYLGSDPSHWAEGVPRYAEVRLEELYPDIALRLYGEEGLLRYDLVAEPGADLAQARFRLEGAGDVRVTPEGHLAFETTLGEVRQADLVAYQEVGGRRVLVEAAFALREDGQVGFEAQPLYPDVAVVIDPLVYSTFLGGADGEDAFAIATEGGSAYVTGRTWGADYPTTTGAYQTSRGGGITEAFVTKLDSDGTSLAYSTFLGGSGNDRGNGIAVESGSAYVTGETRSTDYPTTTGAYQSAHGGGTDDAFVARLASGGGTLAYSTFLGGGDNDRGYGIAVESGSAYVTGETWSTDYPTTTGAYQSAHGGSVDVFVTQLASDGGSLIYSTFLGGSGNDRGNGIAVESGSAYVTGETRSTDYPTTTGAYQSAHGGGTDDAFVARLASGGGTLAYSTFLGGSNVDAGRGIAVESGSAYVAGATSSTDYPTTTGAYQETYGGGGSTKMALSTTSGAYQETYGGVPEEGGDAFVTQLSADGSSLAYSTYLGGEGGDEAHAIAVESGRAYVTGTTQEATETQTVASGSAYVTGNAESTDFPTTDDAYQSAHGGAADAFVAQLSSGGSSLTYSTFLGGSRGDEAHAIAVESGSAYVAGETESTDYPASTGAYDETHNGNGDVFVTTLSITDPACTDPQTEPLYAGGFATDTGLQQYTLPVEAQQGLEVVRVYNRFNMDVGASLYDQATGGNPITNYTRSTSADTVLFTWDGTGSHATEAHVPFTRENTSSTTVRFFMALTDGCTRTVDIDPLFEIGTSAETEALPHAVTLAPAAPNPVRQQATLRYALPEASAVRLAVYDVLGREVAVLHEGHQAAGHHSAQLDAADLPAGPYVVRLQAGPAARTQTLVVLR